MQNISMKNCGYEISRLGNKKEDYQKSNVEYKDNDDWKYEIVCENCKQTFHRKRLNKNFEKRYRCGKCGGKFVVKKNLGECYE